MIIKVQELYDLCKEEIIKGNADKKILISGDDEGNSYHELFYGFCDELQDEKNSYLYEDCIYGIDKEDFKDYIILG